MAVRPTRRAAAGAARQLEEIAERLGSSLRVTSLIAHGASTDTYRIELDDGRSLAAQRLIGATAVRRVATATAIATRLAAAGVPVPGPVSVVRVGRVSWLAAPWVDGESGRQWLDTAARSRRLAAGMGALTIRLARADASDLGLERGWGNADEVQRMATACLTRLSGSLGADEVGRLRDAAAIAGASPAGASPVFAHGDFAPVNVILAPDGAVRAMLDLESARLSAPLLDVAWWGWILRFHHADAWARTWPVFLDAAGVVGDRETTVLIEAIQRVRCLELAASARDPISRAAWLARLRATLQWPRSAGSSRR